MNMRIDEGKRAMKKDGYAHLRNRTPEEKVRIARLGGVAISQNKTHMSTIGKKGGAVLALDREHMRKIGRLGGLAAGRRGSE